jgi:hypothetical protein
MKSAMGQGDGTEGVMPIGRGWCQRCGNIVEAPLTLEAARNVGASSDQPSRHLARLIVQGFPEEVGSSLLKCRCGGLAVIEECGLREV